MTESTNASFSEADQSLSQSQRPREGVLPRMHVRCIEYDAISPGAPADHALVLPQHCTIVELQKELETRLYGRPSKHPEATQFFVLSRGRHVPPPPRPGDTAPQGAQFLTPTMTLADARDITDTTKEVKEHSAELVIYFHVEERLDHLDCCCCCCHAEQIACCEECCSCCVLDCLYRNYRCCVQCASCCFSN